MTTLEPAVTAPPFGMNVGDPHTGSTEAPELLVELAPPELLLPELLDPDPDPELLLDPEPLALPLPDPEAELPPSGLFGPELEPEPLPLASPMPLSSGTSGTPM